MVAELKPARDLSKPPIFQVSLSYQADPLPSVTMAGLEVRRLPLTSPGARFDLELQLFDNAGAVTGWIEYDRDLFDEPAIAAMAAGFRRLAEHVVAQPGTPVGRLDLLGDERARILGDRRATERRWPGSGWIHECFEERARQAPGAEALRWEGQSLSYAELNRRANQLAHRLRRLGAGPDVLVGVSMERSPELVISLLAVLKAGAAYVPLDPGYPRARLAHMLADAGVPLLLTQRPVLAALPPVPGTVLCVDELAESLADRARRRSGGAGGRGEPGLRDLHLRLDRHAQGRDERARGASATGCCGCRTPTASTRPTGCCRRRRSASTSRCGSSSGR